MHIFILYFWNPSSRYTVRENMQLLVIQVYCTVEKAMLCAESENLIRNYKERINISDWHNAILTDAYRNLILYMYGNEYERRYESFSFTQNF